MPPRYFIDSAFKSPVSENTDFSVVRPPASGPNFFGDGVKRFLIVAAATSKASSIDQQRKTDDRVLFMQHRVLRCFN